VPHIFLTANANAGNLNSTGIVFATGNVEGGNLVTNGLLTVQGNANVGNITTKSIDGTVITISGNVSGANLVASGILSVAGTANVGNLNLPSKLIAITSVSYASTTVTVTTTDDHGLSTGAEITMTGISTNGANPPNINGGNLPWFIITVTGARTFTYVVTATPTGTLNFSTATLNARPYLISNGSASYGGNISASGTVVATLFNGNGASLSGITGSNVVGAVPNATYAASALSSTNSGTVTASSQPNITSVGQLISLAVNGTASIFSNGTATFDGNVNAAYINANGSLLTSINGSNVSKVGSATNSDTVTGGTQSNITLLGTLTSLDVSGSTTMDGLNATN
jgi:hypothetical protein